MNTIYNPLLRATRAAWSELTTPEAQRWYWQQIRNSAVLAQKVTLQGVTVARQWVSAIHGQAAVVEPVQTDTLGQAAAPEQTDVVVKPQDNAPANRLTSPVNEQQVSEAVEFVAETADIGPELAPTAWAATDEIGGAAEAYELFKDCNNISTAEVESLLDSETPFDDALECGPPFLIAEDDTSLDEDTLLEEEVEPDSFSLTPDQWGDLASVIQEFKQQQVIPSAESIVGGKAVHSTHASNSIAGGKVTQVNSGERMNNSLLSQSDTAPTRVSLFDSSGEARHGLILGPNPNHAVTLILNQAILNDFPIIALLSDEVPWFYDREPIQLLQLSELVSDSGIDPLSLELNATLKEVTSHSRQSLLYCDDLQDLLSYESLACLIGNCVSTGRSVGLSVLLHSIDLGVMQGCSHETAARIVPNLSFILSDH